MWCPLYSAIPIRTLNKLITTGNAIESEATLTVRVWSLVLQAALQIQTISFLLAGGADSRNLM
eukprot:429476-Pelagomonas_calceolata.AAC.2